MPSSRNHQEAHGIGQIEEQLQQQADAAKAIQGSSETDREIAEAAKSDKHTALDEIVGRKE
ncbi:hypothetical protein [Paenibacillus wynnii]|uniref:hypothetical protein n=1 Tax=Paenibacillus wynnii TaxID=268407 RepID=UPI0027909F54|nr:hypothetical protein [Paenibacillus wynnii]MDQ0195629.1 hypothetical protein [Paenibacillus wynnii]